MPRNIKLILSAILLVVFGLSLASVSSTGGLARFRDQLTHKLSANNLVKLQPV